MDAKRKDHGVEAPVSLMGLFAGEGASDDECGESFVNEEEIQQIQLAGMSLSIKQCAWHQTNANKVWPGTFVLAEYIEEHRERYMTGKMIELGTATGALAIFLRKKAFIVMTSDIDDGGYVEELVNFNLGHNGEFTFSVSDHMVL